MIVFKTFLKILNKNKIMFIFYTILLFSITMMNTTNNENNMSYVQSKPAIFIVNNDEEGIITKDFVKYLDSNTKIIKIKNNEESIDDALFNRRIQYVIYIPKNFSDELIKGNKLNLDIKKVEHYNSAFAEMIINRYLNLVTLYSKDIKDIDILLSKVNDQLNKNINIEVTSKVGNNSSKLNFYYNFVSYSIMASLVYIICIILSSFRNTIIRKRNIVSSMNYKKLNRQLLLSNFILSFIVWFIYVLLSFIVVGNSLFSINGLIYCINLLVYTICATAVAFLIGNAIGNKNALTGIINVVALGTSFLCGVFVPLNMLPNIVVFIGHLLPTYYYVKTNDLLSGIEVFNFNTLKPIVINICIIILFTIVFMIISNIIYNKKRKIS